MTCDIPAAEKATVTLLRDQQTLECDSDWLRAAVIPLDTDTRSLECLLGNPRFSRPANQGYDGSCEDFGPAPKSKACREARLIRMWAEELAELEFGNQPARCSVL